MLPKVSKVDMAGIMESIKEYLRSCHGVITVPVAYIIRKTLAVDTYGDSSNYMIPHGKMINRILHLPIDKNKLHN